MTLHLMTTANKMAARWSAFLLALFVLTVVASATPPTSPEKPASATQKKLTQEEINAQARELVQQLDADSFAEREAATKQLMQLGPRALKVIQEGLKHSSPEVRTRCNRLILGIKGKIRQQRLDAFASGSKTISAKQLPGWDRFKKLVGDTSPMRLLFVELWRAEPQLMEMANSNPKATAALAEKILQKYQRNEARPTGLSILHSQMALLFVFGDERITYPATVVTMAARFCQYGHLKDALRKKELHEPMQKLYKQFFTRSVPEPALSDLLTVAQRCNLDEKIIMQLARKLALANSEAIALQRGLGILTIAQYGTAKDIALLQPLFEKDSLCMDIHQRVRKNGKTITVVYPLQVRDIALATVIHLSDQDLQEFGFPRAKPNGPYPFGLRTIVFVSDKERQAAFKKWADFCKKNKKGAKAKSSPAQPPRK